MGLHPHAGRRRDFQNRTVEWIQIEFAFGAHDAKLIAHDARVPAHVDDAMNALGVLDNRGGRVLDGELMHRIGSHATGTFRLSKQIVHGVDAVGRCVVKRPSAGQRGIAEPRTLFAFKPAVAVGLS